ncbi:MAG: DNA-directed RNA polymerase subunit omega [Vicinamibacterales bacterium]
MDESELQTTLEHQPKVPATPAEPITSRFLFVDVAAMRAKQLRRGALPRFDQPEESSTHRQEWLKAERVAMEEVRRGLVHYDVPELPRSGREM